jgi:hypothetical protein
VIPPVSTSAQLVLASVIFAGFVAVFVIGRRRRPAGVGRRQQLGTGSLYPDRGRTAWVCDLCGDPSPASSSRRVLPGPAITPPRATPSTPTCASPATPERGRQSGPAPPDAPPPANRRKDPPMLRHLARLALVVLVIASTAVVLAVYAHNAAAMP